MELKLKELPFELFDKIYLYVIFRPRTYRQLKKAVDEYCDSVFDVEFTPTELIMNHFLGFPNPDFKQEKIKREKMILK